MKKNAKRFLLLLIVCLLVWTVFPRPFAWIIPQRMVNVSGERPEICAETEFTASLSFGIDQEVLDAFYDLHSEMEGVRFLADPLSLLPFLHQPREPVKVKIDYFQEGCSSDHPAVGWYDPVGELAGRPLPGLPAHRSRRI